MAVDPCFKKLLDNPRAELGRPVPPVSLADMRAGNRTFLTRTPSTPIHAVEEHLIDRIESPIAIRCYRPSTLDDLPCILFFHGGGFVLGDLDTHDGICRRLAAFAEAAVFSVNYRLAPEARFPAATEDGRAALSWLSENASQLGIDLERLALCGDSAGANLAVATALMARGGELTPSHVALFYPLLDPACESASMHQFARGYLLTRDAVQWFWECYLGAGGDPEDPLVSPFHADLTGLPPMSVATAEFDPLRDEGELLSRKLRAANVPVASRRYGGMIHGFIGLPHLTPTAVRAVADAAADMQATWRASSSR